jgi:CheY-like chemotaxis protein
MPLGVQSPMGHCWSMRTILADDNPEVRAALRLLLEELGERDVVEAPDLEQAWTALDNPQAIPGGAAGRTCTVLLLDWDLPRAGWDGDGSAEFVRRAKLAVPGCRVIAMSCGPEPQTDCFVSGCDCFVLRSDPPAKLMALLGLESEAQS